VEVVRHLQILHPSCKTTQDYYNTETKISKQFHITELAAER